MSYDSMVGKRFGRFTVTAIKKLSGSAPRAVCRCDCGAVHEAEAKSVRLGRSKSCGCLQRELAKEKATRHGLLLTHPDEYRRLYGAWARCNKPYTKGFKDYGARGITVDERLVESGTPTLSGCELLRQLVADSGLSGSKWEIDRIDNDGPYSPENIRIVDRTANNRNRRSCRKVEFQGAVFKTVVEFSRHINANRTSVNNAVNLTGQRGRKEKPIDGNLVYGWLLKNGHVNKRSVV